MYGVATQKRIKLYQDYWPIGHHQKERKMDMIQISYLIATELARSRAGLRWQPLRAGIITQGAPPGRCELVLGILCRLGHVRRVYDVIWAEDGLYDALASWEKKNIPQF